MDTGFRSLLVALLLCNLNRSHLRDPHRPARLLPPPHSPLLLRTRDLLKTVRVRVELRLLLCRLRSSPKPERSGRVRVPEAWQQRPLSHLPLRRRRRPSTRLQLSILGRHTEDEDEDGGGDGDALIAECSRIHEISLE